MLFLPCSWAWDIVRVRTSDICSCFPQPGSIDIFISKVKDKGFLSAYLYMYEILKENCDYYGEQFYEPNRNFCAICKLRPPAVLMREVPEAVLIILENKIL